MSIRTVDSSIKNAMVGDRNCVAEGHVDTLEAAQIIRSAEKTPSGNPSRVTEGEGKLIGDLFERRVKASSSRPGTMMTMACPENPGATMDTGAVKSFEAFFKRNDLPYGQNVRDKINTALENGYGPELAQAPAGLDKMNYIFMHDHRMVDGNKLEAYVDASKKQFYLKSTGAGMGGPDTIGPYWHGPISLSSANASPKVSDATLSKMRGALNASMDSLEWRPPSQGVPLGVKVVRAPLFAERHPDGFSYTAIIPVGALTPTAPTSDPNKAKQFYVERTGGIAGLTQVAGPISLAGSAPKELTGVRNRMPIVGSNPDYVILPKEGWASPPVSITIMGRNGPRSFAVKDNGGGDYTARGFTFSREGEYQATVKLKNGDEVPLKINVSTVY
jgi:hypothetical protein